MSEQLSIDLNSLHGYINNIASITTQAEQAQKSFHEQTENIHNNFGTQAVSQIKNAVSGTQNELNATLQGLSNSLRSIHQNLVEIKDGFHSISESTTHNIGTAFNNIENS